MTKFQIGDKLLQSRQNLKMTQEQFAAKIGVTPQAVSKWERDLGMPDLSLVAGICEVLHLSADELLGIQCLDQITEGNRKEQQEIQMNLCSEPLRLDVGADLIPAIVEGLKTDKIKEERVLLAKKAGILVPKIRIRDLDALPKNEYQVLSYDKLLESGTIESLGENVYDQLMEKVFNLCEVNYSSILNKQLVGIMIENVKNSYPGIADDIIPARFSYLFVEQVLREIYKKTGTIRNMIGILELLEEVTNEQNEDPRVVADRIVHRLS
ncbi:hypothetical protein lbkm_1410 [Lachnospiraceae bacterium KM106-2]|nr:hypothetical protein lbkm_1410 [Lachnospiraceae bacterium KM106-2]